MPKVDDTKWAKIAWVGPLNKTSHGKWSFNFKPVGGKQTSRSRQTKEDALELHALLKSKMDGQPAIAEGRNLRDFDGSIRWWSELLGTMARDLYMTKDADLRQDLKAIASAGMTAKHLHDQAELEREVEELKSIVAEIHDGWKHGTRITGPDSASPGVAESSPPPV